MWFVSPFSKMEVLKGGKAFPNFFVSRIRPRASELLSHYELGQLEGIPALKGGAIGAHQATIFYEVLGNCS
jgi:hypothetical protein